MMLIVDRIFTTRKRVKNIYNTCKSNKDIVVYMALAELFSTWIIKWFVFNQISIDYLKVKIWEDWFLT